MSLNSLSNETVQIVAINVLLLVSNKTIPDSFSGLKI
jgi:hypothetical protein